MRRLLVSLLVCAGVGGSALLAAGAGDGDRGGAASYWVELDDAFGLVEGADVKVSGVRAGKIAEIDLDASTDAFLARVRIDITKQGFGELRSDVFCESRPQSLIGEYFLDCLPGDADERLKEGGTIPVKQTGTTIPIDLVNNVMRRPFRERFSIIFNELGGALAGRAEDLNETIRRANPALRETDRVLAQLAAERRTIRDLYDNAERILTRVAANRRDAGRFFSEARDTQRAYAAEAPNIRRQFQRLPTFLRELRPTLALLGDVADRQAPALRDLNANAGRLRLLLDTLGPYAEASRPAIRTLASAARAGRRAVRSGRPNIRQLKVAARPLPEAGTNLAITLEHLDDPKYAIEKDPRSPRGGAGYTGLEALLRYVFAQSQAVTLVDANGHLLKVSAFLDNLCAAYTDAKLAKEKARDRCVAGLGPARPGITSPDPTATARAERRSARKPPKGAWPLSGTIVPNSGPVTPGRPTAPAPAAPPASEPLQGIGQLLDRLLPGEPLRLPGARSAPDPSTRSAQSLLDFLLAP
jgi:virulence factor Mce-like protein